MTATKARVLAVGGALWALVGCSTGRPAPAPTLAPPIACEIGEDCWLSSRPDADSSTDAIRDHTGGNSTYDGHSGTDLAVRDVGQAVATWVIAPTAGAVLRTRDRVPDGELLAAGEAAVDSHECGNGVVIDVGAPWELELCHLLRGTVSVQPGDRVAAGDRLGRVGWSGEADHPHVHLTVRRAGRRVDPFSGRHLDDGTPAAPGPLWEQPLPDPADMDALARVGFHAGPPPPDDSWPIDSGRGVLPPSATSLVLEVFLWRPRQGDIVRTEIRRPDGTVTRSEVTQPRDRPRQTWRIEKTWTDSDRPVGLWTARVEWERAGRTRQMHTSTVLQ